MVIELVEIPFTPKNGTFTPKAKNYTCFL